MPDPNVKKYKTELQNFLTNNPGGSMQDFEAQNVSSEAPLNPSDSTTINKPMIGGGNDGNVAIPLPKWNYIGGDENTANIREATIVTKGVEGIPDTYDGSGGYTDPEKWKKWLTTPDGIEYTKKIEGTPGGEEIITQERFDWTKDYVSEQHYLMDKHPDQLNWKWYVNKINTGGDGPDTNFTVEQFREKLEEVGTEKFRDLLKRKFPWLWGRGSSSGTSTSGKSGWR